jgi:hypothetical protein
MHCLFHAHWPAVIPLDHDLVVAFFVVFLPGLAGNLAGATRISARKAKPD